MAGYLIDTVVNPFGEPIELGLLAFPVTMVWYVGVTHSFNLSKKLAASGVPDIEFSYFLEVSSARFWFHTQRARDQIRPLLERVPSCSVIGHEQMKDYGIPLENSDYGEVFCFLDPGHIFFPHDFNQPFANIFFSITDPMQRKRLINPRHRGNHGHLPHFEVEKSMLLLTSLAFRTRNIDEPNILDVAPTMLSILGLPISETMRGRPLYEAMPTD